MIHVKKRLTHVTAHYLNVIHGHKGFFVE